MSGNDVTLVGNLARDPELRFSAGGLAVANVGLAVNRRWKNPATGEQEESVSFFDVTLWRELAENAAETLGKGDRVFVTGRLEQNTWETPEGEKRTKVIVIADDIGPSLKWATAQVTRNERRGGDAAPARDAPADYGEEPF